MESFGVSVPPSRERSGGNISPVPNPLQMRKSEDIHLTGTPMNFHDLETNDKPLVYTGPLTLRTLFENWYVIEKVCHEHKDGFTQVKENHFRYFNTARISDADVEGTSSQLKRIAQAIKEGKEYREKRCAVYCDGDKVLLWSPRNSNRKAEVPRHRALELADRIYNLGRGKSERNNRGIRYW